MLATTPLDRTLVEVRARYADRRPLSAAIHAQASAVMPGGNTRTVLYHAPFPIRVVRAEGAIIEDADGHRYVDLLGEFTAGLFGHSHPDILSALSDAMAGGLNLGGHSLHEARLARLVTERFPAMEKLRFTNSGTEANLMAVATALHATGRRGVMVFRGGYHGGILYFAGNGSPLNAPHDYVVGAYNDVEGTRAAIRSAGQALGCILVEPMLGSGGCIPGNPEFLAMLRAESRAVGALLIADEVMTSRFGPSGASALHGLDPDLMTLGKWVGGGMSFGAFGGRAVLMDVYDPGRADGLPHAGTFNNNVLSMCGGIAALTRAFPPAQAEALHARGDALRTRLNRLFEEAGVAVSASGMGSLMNIHGCATPPRTVADLAASSDARKELLYFDLLEQGFYMARRGFIALSLMVDDALIYRFIDSLASIVQMRAPMLRADRP